MVKEYDLVDLAEQQFLGFKAGQRGESIGGLAESMGLGSDELKELITRHPEILTQEEITEINKQL